MGYFIDKNDSRLGARINLFIMIVTVLVTFFIIHWTEFSFAIYVMGGLWGLQDGAMNVHIMQALGFEFQVYKNGEPFGVFNIVQGSAAFIIGIIQGRLDTNKGQVLEFYIIFIGIFGLIACFTAIIFPYKYIKKQESKKKKKKKKFMTRDEYLHGQKFEYADETAS